jgi:hypothetical protein
MFWQRAVITKLERELGGSTARFRDLTFQLSLSSPKIHDSIVKTTKIPDSGAQFRVI